MGRILWVEYFGFILEPKMFYWQAHTYFSWYFIHKTTESEDVQPVLLNIQKS